MVRHLRKPGHPRRRRLVSYRPPVRSITPRQPPGRSASLPLSFLSLSLHFALLPPLNFLSFPLPLSSHLFPSVSTLHFLSSSFYHFSYRDSFSCIPISLFACIPQERLSTLLLLFRSPLPRLARRCSPCCCAFASLSLSLSKRERGKGERRDGRDVLFVEVGSNRQPSGWKRRDGPPRTP